jgi:hypothetical protein
MEKKLMELYESIANEHNPQELRELILWLRVILEAKEQRLRDPDNILDTTSTSR